MNESFIELSIVYEDLPDMIELAVAMCHEGWSANARIYLPPTLLIEDGAKLIDWSYKPESTVCFGTDIHADAGGIKMEFKTINASLHVCCAFQVGTRSSNRSRAWHASVVIPTELGLVERFGHECIALGRTLKGQARLVGIHE